MPDYDLKSVMAKVRNKQMNFILLKGEKGSQVAISAKPVSPKLIEEAEEEIGKSKRVAKGICFQDGAAFVFATKSTPSPAWEATITKLFKENACAKFLPVVVRQLGEDELDEADATDDGAEQAPEAPSGTVPPPPPPPQGTVPPAPGVVPPPPGTVPPPPPAPPAPPQAANPAQVAKLQEALQKITPAIKARVVAYPSRKDDILRMVQSFQGQLAAGTLDAATGTLKQLAALLQSLGSTNAAAAVPAPDAAGEDGADFTAAWASAQQKFDAAVASVDAQINKLQAALRAADDEELTEIAELGLNGITGNFRVPMQAALRDVTGASADKRAAAAKKARATMAKFRAHLNSDPRIEACDSNPFGVSVRIADTYNEALDELDEALAAA